MKKRYILPLMALLSAPAYSDFVGIYAGVGLWNADIDGNVGVNANNQSPVTDDELGLGGENNNHFYIAFEHPIPVIPNLMLSHTAVVINGNATVDRDFTLDEQTFAANAATTTEIDLTHTDITLYYEILDNWVNADVGLTARKMDGYAEIAATYSDTNQGDLYEKVDLDIILPLLYGKARVDLPFTGWFVGATLNYISLSDNTFSDLSANVGYTTDGLGLDIGFEAGLRQMTLDAGSDDDLNADITISGPYAKFLLHF